MIRNDEQLAVQRKLLGCIERALESLRLETEAGNPKNFAIYAEGYFDQIQSLQAEIDDYLARQHAPAAPGHAGSPSGEPHANVS